MKKVIKLENLDCANCAAKMESAISKIHGVKSVNINFMLQRMTLEADDDCYEQILAEAKKVCKKVEPDCLLKI